MNKAWVWFLIFVQYLDASDLQISQSESVTSELIPTRMSTDFSFSKEDKSVNAILKTFETITTEIKNFMKENTDTKCEGGSNNIYPKYHYTNNKSVFVGYQGSVSYACNFKDIKTYNKLMNMSFLTNEKISLSPIKWIVDPEEINQIKSSQKLQLLTKAIDIATLYSSHLKKICKLAQVDFNSYPTQPIYEHQPRMMAKSMDAGTMASENYEPIKKEIQLQTNASIKVVCQ